MPHIRESILPYTRAPKTWPSRRRVRVHVKSGAGYRPADRFSRARNRIAL